MGIIGLDSISLVAVTLLLCTFVVARRYKRHASSQLPLPPGPRRLPIIGNLLDVPKTMSAVEYSAFTENYGDVVYLDVLGKPMLILGSMEAAQELMDKRSGIYSGKPPSSMADLIELGWNLALMPNREDHWKKQRREIHRFVGTQSVSQYFMVIERQVRVFLKSLLVDPGKYAQDAHLALGAMILQIAYGLDVKSLDDEYMRLAQEGNDIFQEAFIPGKYLVETFPILKKIPAWFPGAKFQREAAEWKKAYGAVRTKPFDAAMNMMRRGKAESSIAAQMVRSTWDEKGTLSSYDEQLAKDVSATLYLAGAETTLTTIRIFFLAMATFPHVQERAQAELLRAIGSDRLPSLADRQDLPYVDAVLKECFRWHPILPLALPHQSVEEDEYRGWCIPKGCVVLANSWAFSRDSKYYPDPEEFKPERYLMEDGSLNKNVLDPRSFTFGYGRRLCPGRHLGEAASFSFIASILHTFNIAPPLNAQGFPVVPKPKFAPDFLACPEAFDCGITIRSEEAKKLVFAEAVDIGGEV